MSNLTKLINIRVSTRSQQLLSTSTQIPNAFRESSDDVRFLTRTDPANLRAGRGGRSSFSGVVATVFGASGFMGKYVLNRLGKTGTQTIIPYRGDDYHVKHLRVASDLGQMLFLPYHLCDEEAIRKAVKYSNVVINLVGRDWETRNFTFHQVHVEGARRIAKISKEAGVEKFIHMSALNSNMEHEGYMKPGGSVFLQTKGESEEVVKEFFPDAIIFRPSDCWGQQDRFLFYFCRFMHYQGKYMPLPFAGRDIWKQPVYIGDVAHGICNAVFDHDAVGNTYEAVGPRRYELCELIDWFNRVMRREGEWGYRRYDMKWDPIAKLKAKLNERYSPSVPTGVYTVDKIEREAVSDTTFGLPNLEDLGVSLTKLEDRITWELKHFRTKGYYDESVGEFEKPAPPKYIEAA